MNKNMFTTTQKMSDAKVFVKIHVFTTNLGSKIAKT